MEDEVLQALKKIRDSLAAKSQTVVTAESCTGGILASWLTHLPGSSKSYLGGISAYANQVKSSLLGVDPRLIVDHGAVSAEVATAMAQGAQTKIGATFAIAITGIAGPEGGSMEKPVGTVYCGFASPKGVDVFLWHISGDREKIRHEAATRALMILKNALD